jgi:uncharacterized protein YndB with AHSA1/START domain
MSNNVSLHRIIKTNPEKLFRAFTDPLAVAAWMPPHGFLCTVHHLQAHTGGTFRMSFHNFTTGHTHSFGGQYLEVRPAEYLRYTDVFDDPNLPGQITTTITLRPTLAGTELTILQENLPTLIPVDMCYLGWQESLFKLANLVEPHIPDA